jgi:hypothetical protein
MDKKSIVRFLKGKRRGIYPVIVDLYAEQILSSSINLALDLIRDDLELETGEKVDLNYFSLNQAALKYKNKNVNKKVVTPGKTKGYDFKDAHEIKNDRQLLPGQFKLDD